MQYSHEFQHQFLHHLSSSRIFTSTNSFPFSLIRNVVFDILGGSNSHSYPHKLANIPTKSQVEFFSFYSLFNGFLYRTFFYLFVCHQCASMTYVSVLFFALSRFFTPIPILFTTPLLHSYSNSIPLSRLSSPYFLRFMLSD